MSVEIIDGQIVTEFVNDSPTFEKWTEEKFKALDADGNGVLSRDELQNRVGKFSSREFELQSAEEITGLYDALFDKFDVDRSGNIHRGQFTALMREVMLAKARGLGDLPVCVILQEDSLLMRAIQRANMISDLCRAWSCKFNLIFAKSDDKLLRDRQYVMNISKDGPAICRAIIPFHCCQDDTKMQERLTLGEKKSVTKCKILEHL